MKHILTTSLLAWMLLWVPASFSQEPAESLYSEGNRALSKGDYVTASYYFQRLIDSDFWNDFPKKTDTFRKMAMIEEAQAQFEKAAGFYHRLIDLLPEAKDEHAQTMVNYYYQRYAENLQRAGGYERAATIYWKLIAEAQPENRVGFIRDVIENYGFQQVSKDQMDKLEKTIIPQYFDSLGWELANLYYLQGQHQKSYQLFEKLWPADPGRAVEFVTPMTDLYSTLDKLDAWAAAIHARREEGNDSPSLLLLEAQVLESMNRGSEALQQVETYIVNRTGMKSPADIDLAIMQIPPQILNRWIDLVLRFRGSDHGITLLQNLLQKVPMDLTRRKQLSDLLFQEGRKEEAVKLWSQWAETQSQSPTSVFHAAQEIYAMGETAIATSLLQSLKDRIPPALSWRQGQIALQFGNYSNAAAAFDIAMTSGNIHPSMIVSLIRQHVESQQNSQELASFLIQSASGKPYTAISNWMKESLIWLGNLPPNRPLFQTLLDTDPTGVWHYYSALECLKQGDSERALSLLDAIPSESIYAVISKMKRAEILTLNASPLSQRKAADLLEPSMASLLSSTAPLTLNATLIDRLLSYAEMRLNAYQPNPALRAIQTIESSSGAESFPSSLHTRIRYNRARALTELGSLQPAIDLLNSVTQPPYQEEAQFLLARIYIAQRKTDMALTILTEIADNPSYWRRMNDALSLLVVLEPLVGESQQLFCDAMLYQLQGRLADAIPSLRQLAVNYYGDDMEEWARYSIGRLKENSGDWKGARDEWKRLLLESDNPVIQGMARLDLMQHDSAASSQAADVTGYLDIMNELPNSIFSDLARLEMQRQLGKVQP